MAQSKVEPAADCVLARILLVEDEPLVRFLLADELRERGVSVVEASSADEAWQFLMSGESVDLVFTDHRMPGSLSGAQLAARIQQQYPGLPVIVTSAYFDAREWSGPVLEKPYSCLQTAAELIELAAKKRREAGDR